MIAFNDRTVHLTHKSLQDFLTGRMGGRFKKTLVTLGAIISLTLPTKIDTIAGWNKNLKLNGWDINNRLVRFCRIFCNMNLFPG